MEEPSSNCESRETEYENDEHDNPAPVGTHPGKVIELACEWRGVLQALTYQGPGVGFVELFESC